jgi:type VI secretion system protein ImpG
MDPHLLEYYNRELKYIREMGMEFAREFPKIAGRLDLGGFECKDPYVERLLEGFAFMAARVQLKVDTEFHRFTQYLLEIVYPHYLAPTPSMAVVHFQPELTEGSLNEGVVIPRGSWMRSLLGEGQTPCTYRTAQDVTLWPLELTEAEYLSNAGAVAAMGIPLVEDVGAAIRLRLRATAGLTFDKLALDRLTLFLGGSENLPIKIYEQLLGHTLATVVCPTQRPATWNQIIRASPVQRRGFDDQEALLPFSPRTFQGYRLLQEYFAFPERFLFVELNLKNDQDLHPVVQRCTDNEIEIVILLDRVDSSLHHTLNASNFVLFCAPAINLFPKSADRIHITDRTHEHHVVPDRNRPMDFEVYQVTGVKGFGTRADSEREFLPFYAAKEGVYKEEEAAYYTVYREPRVLSRRQRRIGTRSRHYIGSEAFVSIVDAREIPFGSDLRQLSVQTLCTNRDLPIHMPVGKKETDFTLVTGAPVNSIRCVAGPTEPRPSVAHGETAWRLISHLSLNYLSLIDTDSEQGASALRELLTLYGDMGNPHIRRQIDGVRFVSSSPIIRRVPSPGPITVARGLEITAYLDEVSFEGTGAFLIGAVLEQFFRRYASINSFTETVIKTEQRGEIMRWPVTMGRRHIL